MRYAPSLFDKLCPRRGDMASCGPARSLSIEEVKDAVAHDLESLLNTRRPAWAGEEADDDGAAIAGPLCRRSIAAYGIADFSSRSLASGLDRDHICASIRQAIECHETRLRGVRVSLDEAEGGPRRRLRFVIRAVLALQGASEPVSFDAAFEPAVQRYAIARGRA